MIIFENTEFDFVNFLIATVFSIIIYFAWKSTNVREDRLATAVFIIENRRRLLNNIVRQPAIIVRSSSRQSDNSNTTEEVDVDEDRTSEPLQIPEAPSLQAVLNEVTDLAASRNSGSDYRSVEENLNDLLDDSDVGPQHIIEEMDNPDAEGLRRRRLAFYTGESSTSQNSGETSNQSSQTTSRRENLNLPSQDSTDNSHAENCSNENNENENISKIDNKTAAGDAGDCHQQKHEEINDEFRIKLKYLNDELRLVKGNPNEAIGDFKKKNFTVELAAQKLVRLVFNGHVLQPDSKTLQACGLFDNCVVHCLIHNKKPSAGGGQDDGRTSQSENHTTHRQGGLGSNMFTDRNSNGPLFVYLGIALVSLALGFCWYCRVQYSYLFSWYSTIGLILMTALFLVMFPLIILIEREVTTT